MDIPTFITALATLVTAIASLLKVFQVQRQNDKTHETLNVVNRNTNGALKDLQQSMTDMRSSQATPAEMAARPDAVPISGGTGLA